MDFYPTGRMVLGSTIWLMRLKNSYNWFPRVNLRYLALNQESVNSPVVSYTAIDLSIFIRYKKERLIVCFWEDFRTLCCLRLIPMSFPSG
jgi:hypothetical protein